VLGEYARHGSFHGSHHKRSRGETHDSWGNDAAARAPYDDHGGGHGNDNSHRTGSGPSSYSSSSSSGHGGGKECVLVSLATRQWLFGRVANRPAFFWAVQAGIALHVGLLIGAPWPYSPAAEAFQNAILAAAIAELVNNIKLFSKNKSNEPLLV
jgi:hypothetical protein